MSVISDTNTFESNILIKITKKKYAADIQAGKLYMNKLGYFRKLEQDGVGDDQEGLMGAAQNGKMIRNGEVVAEILDIKTYLDFPVFCALSVPLTKVGDNKYEFVIPKKLLKEFMYDKSAEYVLIAIDKSEFIKRIDKALSDQELCGRSGNVSYTDEISFFPKKDIDKMILRKRTKFAYQYEWRVFVECHVDDHFELNIGDITDISKQIPIQGSDQEVKIEVFEA